MKKNTLKLILGIPKKDKYKEEELDNNSGWYLHGKLEKDVGYDKAIAVNCKTLGISKETRHIIERWKIGGKNYIRLQNNLPRFEMHFNGIINVEVEGVPYRCKGYFWTVMEEKDITVINMEKYEQLDITIWLQRGLVCYANDTEANKYALQHYKSKSITL